MAPFIRCVIATVLVASVIAVVAGFLPGIDVHRSAAEVVRETPVRDSFGCALYMMLLCGPAFALWRRPQLAFALVWSVWALAVAFTMIALAFPFGDRIERIEYQFVAYVFTGAAGAVHALLLVVLPLGCIGIGLHDARAGRHRRPPRAQVVRRRSRSAMS